MQVRRVLLHAVHTDHTRARICSACAWRECRADRASGKGTRRRVAHVTSCRPSTHAIFAGCLAGTQPTRHTSSGCGPTRACCCAAATHSSKTMTSVPSAVSFGWGLRLCGGCVVNLLLPPPHLHAFISKSTRGNWTVQLIQPLLSHDSTDNLSLRSGAFCMTGSWRGGVLHRDGGTPRLPAAV